MRIIRMAALAVAAAICVFAADIDGKWSAQVPGRDGQTRATTFTFKAEGAKLTGSMASDQGSIDIKEGSVTGDTIKFSVETPRGPRNYTGTLSGGELKLKREGGQGGGQEFVAKRATS
jgi:hypothetical protein